MDAGNPMATVGMGVCNTAGPDFGPQCADARFLDTHTCPDDQILSGKRLHKTQPALLAQFFIKLRIVWIDVR